VAVLPVASRRLGSSFLFFKALLQDGVPPFTIVPYGTLFGVLVLGLVLHLAGGRLRLGLVAWRRLGFLGLTNVVPWVIPLAAISLGFVFLGERLRPSELVGAGLVIGGVVLVNGTFGPRPLGRPTGTSADPDTSPGA